VGLFSNWIKINQQIQEYLLTSLFDNLRELGNDTSSLVVDWTCDEELNTGIFNVVDGIWTVSFLFNGLRDGIGGGMSSVVNCSEGSTLRLCFLCEGDDVADFVGIKRDFDDRWKSSSNAVPPSAVDELRSLWSVVRLDFRLN
jgi:hypothetical protein